MKRNFVELQKFLERRYPSLIGSIEGANYPPPPHAQVRTYLHTPLHANNPCETYWTVVCVVPPTA